jgi:hypothetical protein
MLLDSVLSLCVLGSLCLCSESCNYIHHGHTEDTEDAQREFLHGPILD